MAKDKIPKDPKQKYRTIHEDHFPERMRISFGDGAEENALVYRKVGWDINGEIKGLRYGENPSQEAALYKLISGNQNLVLGDVKTIKPGRYLASNPKLLQSGKHPGKINITDADNALNILRYLMDRPTVAIMKHNNPCGVAIGTTLIDAYTKANLADRLAAFGGTIALNRIVDKATAEAIVENYSEVVVAPGYESGVRDIFEKKKDLRVMEIRNMERLRDWVGVPVLDFKSLIDGGIAVQSSYVAEVRTLEDIKECRLGETEYNGETHKINREPTEQEYKDMLFGWLVEAGVTSNSVIYVKDGVTVGIGTGEQDRVGVAKIARDKAYEKIQDKICFEATKKSYDEVMQSVSLGNN